MRRLTFKYRGDQIELLSDQQVDMKVPARPKTDPKARAPFWFELRDIRGHVLQRIEAADPIPRDTEVFSSDPSQSLRRVPYAPTEGVFVVVVPDVADAEEIALMREAAPEHDKATTRAAAEPIEVARFKLRKG